MNNSIIFVPKTINVGYQNRQGTYTGKLAYVIYTDEKGTLRKEASWNSWRDESIEPDTFDNTPTTGFVLNKKVGDTCSHWNFRQAYCRVYDPRGFEFEITIENLLYILENTNSIVGKGLEGEFVYGWDGKDLVLLPTCSPDYRNILEYNNARFSNTKITTKDLKIGATYKGKDGNSYIYLGKFKEYENTYYPYWVKQNVGELKHWFWKIPKENVYPFNINPGNYNVETRRFDYERNWEHNMGGYITRKSVSKGWLISVIDETPSTHLHTIMNIISHNRAFSRVDINNIVCKKFTKEEFLNYVKTTWDNLDNYKKLYYHAPITFFTNSDKTFENYSIGVQSTNNYTEKIIQLYKRTKSNANWHNCYALETNSQNNISILSNLDDDTILKLFDMYRPEYADVYLENGEHYMRSYEYLPPVNNSEEEN